MPSTRKQKAKEKRSRQSDVMSDFENLDVMLGSYRRDNSEMQDRTSENEIGSESNRREGSSNQNENNYRSYLNTNLSENSCLTVETSKAISSEISSEMSRKFGELQSSLNSQILDVMITRNFVVRNFVVGNFVVGKFVVRNFVARNFVVRNFVVRNFIVGNFVVGDYVL